MKGCPTQNVTWRELTIGRPEREALNRHRGATVWLTGLSGSGKSTIADLLAARLHSEGVHTAVLDGDNIRHGLNCDLGFSPEARTENIRRIAEVAKLLTSFGIINMVAFISPYSSDRDSARGIQDKGDFIEVFVHAPLEVAEERDPKGLYKKARLGLIKEFTGIDAPYEVPVNPELVLHTHLETPEESVEAVVVHLRRAGILKEE
ncbi:MAG: adenylyl-sulfate kinase [Candidatus Fermentibacteraceae bacterium]